VGGFVLGPKNSDKLRIAPNGAGKIRIEARRAGALRSWKGVGRIEEDHFEDEDGDENEDEEQRKCRKIFVRIRADSCRFLIRRGRIVV
jgi:hypothetical protein